MTTKNRNEEAIECYDEALKIGSDNINCHYGKGIILGRLAMYEDAVFCFDIVLNMDPTNRAAILNKGISI